MATLVGRWGAVLAAAAAVAVALLPGAAAAGWRAEGPGGGNVRSVAFAPAQPATVYAATNSGGVWRSDDGGATWRLPGDGLTRRDVEWVAVEPGDPRAVWAGVKAGRGAAVWRSTDGGVTWEALAASYPGGRVQPVGQPIAFSGAEAKTLLLPSTNLHYRSDDGGKSWRDFRVPNQDAYVFAFHPSDPKIVYAGGRGDSLNLARSNDGGKTWRQVGIGLGKTSLRALLLDPAEPSTLYAAGRNSGMLYKSTDAGDNFAPVALPVPGSKSLFDLAMHPRDGRILWAATEAGLFKTEDGGASWRESDRGLGRYLATAIAFDPRDPTHLVVGTGGTGIFDSRDSGASWTPAREGIAAGWAEKLWGVPGGALFAQLSIGLYRYDGPGGWTEIREPFASGKEAKLDGIVFDATSRQTLHAFDGSILYRSTDGGRRFQAVEQKGLSTRDMLKGNIETVQFRSLAQDRGNPQHFYAGSWSSRSTGGAVYKTTDGGKKWAPAGQGLPGETIGMLRAGEAGTVLAVVERQKLYRTTNAGGSWTVAGTGLPGTKIHELEVDATNPARLFAATEKGLFRSADGGASFARVGEGAVEGDDVEGLVIDPASGAVYVGSFHGVFRSTDGGDTWTPFVDGLTHRGVRALALAGEPTRLWAGTAGGSIHSTELP